MATTQLPQQLNAEPLWVDPVHILGLPIHIPGSPTYIQALLISIRVLPIYEQGRFSFFVIWADSDILSVSRDI